MKSEKIKKSILINLNVLRCDMIRNAATSEKGRETNGLK